MGRLGARPPRMPLPPDAFEPAAVFVARSSERGHPHECCRGSQSAGNRVARSAAHAGGLLPHVLRAATSDLADRSHPVSRRPARDQRYVDRLSTDDVERVPGPFDGPRPSRASSRVREFPVNRWTFLLAALVAATTIVRAQAQTPAIAITSPTEDVVVMGAAHLSAVISPPVSVERVSFFADGRIICEPHSRRMNATGTREARCAAITYASSCTSPTAADSSPACTRRMSVRRAGRRRRHTGARSGDEWRHLCQRTEEGRFHDCRRWCLTADCQRGQSGHAARSRRRHRHQRQHGPNARRRETCGEAAVVEVASWGCRDIDWCFNETTFIVAERETNQRAREDAVDLLAPWGGTALYDATIRCWR